MQTAVLMAPGSHGVKGKQHRAAQLRCPLRISRFANVAIIPKRDFPRSARKKKKKEKKI